MPPVLRAMRQVPGLETHSCLRRPAWQPEVYPVSGAREQVLLRTCPCLFGFLPPQVLWCRLLTIISLV